jgi:hypothetical protein
MVFGEFSALGYVPGYGAQSRLQARGQGRTRHETGRTPGEIAGRGPGLNRAERVARALCEVRFDRYW